MVLMVELSLAPKWLILFPFWMKGQLENDHLVNIQNVHPSFHWYSIPFLSEAVEASRCYFFWKQRMYIWTFKISENWHFNHWYLKVLSRKVNWKYMQAKRNHIKRLLAKIYYSPLQKTKASKKSFNSVGSNLKIDWRTYFMQEF